MKYYLSFGGINIIGDTIAEVIIEEGVVMTLEMCEEYDAFLLDHFPQPFGILSNRLHNYSYTYEAKLHTASLENLKAIAVITYNQEAKKETENLVKHRLQDNLNYKEFSGLQLGRDNGIKWLENELATIIVDS
ncbi:hypothetical protein [Thalassotalea sp. ND16A]|uniref:hypothetical protein n=1 Tax=Thalassotalea sp. ND16A TaxID=1535422 RepID=UPI00051A3382|nr:hypothetical protein [Thalassotalea sp. ND16A]KGK01098.1 hypothetical protein ND16A_3105 [Thalassotalea sp. ND16A]